MEALIGERGVSNSTIVQKRIENIKESLLWMLKFQPSLLKNVRFKRKIRPSQVLSSGQKVSPAVLGIGWDT